MSAAAATAATLFIALPAVAGAAPPKPPPPPQQKTRVTQQQVNTSAAAKAAMASEVGRISGELAAAQAQLQTDVGKQELAEQKVAYAVSELQKAQQKEVAAKAGVARAQHNVTVAHTRFVQYIQATYTTGDINGTGGSLLTADNPAALLDQSALAQYQSRTKADAVGGMQRATVARSNAEALSRKAVQVTQQAKARADAAKAAADAQVIASQQHKAQLDTEIAQKQQQLDAAQAQYANILQGRHEYVAYRQAVAARDRAITAYNAYKAHQAELARERAAAARAAAAARKHHKHHHGSSGGGGGGSSGGGGGSFQGGSSGPAAPSGGGWTAAKGRAAAKRALHEVGMPYIWAAGSKWGPDDGGCNDPIAACGTVGFDCSGLVLYAWGKNWAHYANSQYNVGSVHPSPGHFKPGDLLFWWEGGEFGHVAIYIGHGDVVQAPQSGERVKVTPWDQVQSGYGGATRPLT